MLGTSDESFPADIASSPPDPLDMQTFLLVVLYFGLFPREGGNETHLHVATVAKFGIQKADQLP